ncbi:LPS-assembly protein LptD [Teredinibacter haidensis]|uniref:LPS-assembly protein LptD n=1 Tax=Teredinibacter haidensis TaxID=2731755 RepID=UPI000948DEC9|nr:LPS-assembly protein LptD [Teredinibacter haidensis]
MPKSSARHKQPKTSRRTRLDNGSLLLFFSPLLCVLTASPLADDTLTDKEKQQRYDFHPFQTLSPEQQQQIVPGCEGLYIDPMQSIADALGEERNNLDRFPLEIEADKTVVREGETALLEGNVVLSQGARRILADKMTYEITSDRASMEGNVVIRQQGVLLHGSAAKANGANHSASFTNAEFVLHGQHLRGGADTISQSAEKVIELENGAFTSCEPGTNTWVLEGEQISIDTQNQQGTGRHIKLRILDVPVLYLPYITFPVGGERKSGLLFPSISVSEQNGVDLALPYYFNLAPNYDATVTPRLISKRGAMLETEFRHLSPLFETTSDIAILVNDQGGRDPDLEDQINQGVISEADAKPYKGQNRWLTHLQQFGGANQRWLSEVDYTQVSDNDYFRDLGISSFSVQNTTHLNQSLMLGYELENWQLSALTQNYQILLYDVDDPYQRLPQINLNGNYQQGPWGTKLTHEYTRFDHDDDYWRNGQAIIKGQRLTTDYRFNLSKRASWGFIKPELGVQSLHYQLDEDALSSGVESSPSVATASASLDTGLIFDHAGGTFLQTLEPRIYYLYRTYDDHENLFNLTDDGQAINFDTSERTFSYSQLYRDSRFSGGDRLEDSNRMTVGVTSNWYHNDSGEEYLSVSLGQIVYFGGQKIALNESVGTQEKSEFAGELRFRLGPWGRFFASSIYDGESSHFTRGTAGVQLATPDSQSLVNLGYSYIRKGTSGSTGIDQLDVSFVSPVAKQWVTMARYNYDYSSGRELEAFAGLEYNDCCYRVRLLARRWLDSNIAALTESEDALYDQGIFFELQLKGLGSSGAKVDAILEDSIYGYRERERRLNQ